MVLSVKNVTSSISSLGVVNKGSPLTINCSAEGSRPPHYVALKKDGVLVKRWTDLARECIGLTYYKFECVHEVNKTGWYNKFSSFIDRTLFTFAKF